MGRLGTGARDVVAAEGLTDFASILMGAFFVEIGALLGT
jgi:hypothetical protein